MPSLPRESAQPRSWDRLAQMPCPPKEPVPEPVFEELFPCLALLTPAQEKGAMKWPFAKLLMLQLTMSQGCKRAVSAMLREMRRDHNETLPVPSLARLC